VGAASPTGKAPPASPTGRSVGAPNGAEAVPVIAVVAGGSALDMLPVALLPGGMLTEAERVPFGGGAERAGGAGAEEESAALVAKPLAVPLKVGGEPIEDCLPASHPTGPPATRTHSSR